MFINFVPKFFKYLGILLHFFKIVRYFSSFFPNKYNDIFYHKSCQNVSLLIVDNIRNFNQLRHFYFT